jgi:hypothetical protein
MIPARIIRKAGSLKKKPADGSAGPEEQGISSDFDGRPQALRAQHLCLFALSMPDRNLLEVRPKRALCGSFRE